LKAKVKLVTHTVTGAIAGAQAGSGTS